MANALLLVAVALWLAAAILALGGVARRSVVSRLRSAPPPAWPRPSRAFPNASETVTLPGRLAAEVVDFRIAPQGLWLMGFGLVPAIFACSLASPMTGGGRGWLFGVALSLLGALGVFGLQNGAALLIAWETMSLGGAIMVLSDNSGPASGRAVLFMLALLEAGAVALVLAIALLGLHAGNLEFDQIPGRRPGPDRSPRKSVSAFSFSSASARSLVCCRFMNGSRAPMARQAERPARSCRASS